MLNIKNHKIVNIFEKLIQIILNILIVVAFLIILLVGYNYIQLEILHKDYTDFFGYTIFEVSTGSMKDTLNIYDVILVKITKEVKQNDIITYKYEDEIITHRIVEIDEEKIITKGDANNTEDKVIKKDNIIGKVISIYSKAGIWVRVFSEPKILISLCITFILVGKVITKENNSDKHRGRAQRKRKEENVE